MRCTTGTSCAESRAESPRGRPTTHGCHASVLFVSAAAAPTGAPPAAPPKLDHRHRRRGWATACPGCQFEDTRCSDGVENISIGAVPGQNETRPRPCQRGHGGWSRPSPVRTCVRAKISSRSMPMSFFFCKTAQHSTAQARTTTSDRRSNKCCIVDIFVFVSVAERSRCN